jgi:hypothetical protein
MAFNLVSGAGAGGAAEGLEKLLMQRFMERKQAEIERAQQVAEQQRAAEMAQAGEQQQFGRRMSLEQLRSLDLSRKEAAADRDEARAARANEFDVRSQENTFTREQATKKDAEDKAFRVGEAEKERRNRITIAQLSRSANGPTQEPLEAVVGPDGKPILLPRSQAAGKTPASRTGATAGRPATGAENKAIAFFNRALEAERNAREVEGQITGRDTLASDWTPEWIANWIRTPEGQRYAQAQKTFTEARLRKESGAAVPSSEYESDRTTNFRASRDLPDTLKQKRRSRISILRGIGNEAGRGLQQFYGEDATLDALLKEFGEEEAAAGGAAGQVQEFDYVPGKGLVPRVK